MSRIAILHPQCVRLGGAIQMALQIAQALTKQGHIVTLYTFEKSDDCFPELQKGLDIRVWDSARKIGFFPIRKLYAMTSLAWELRHVDIVLANNPPMQIVAALAKIFVSRIETIWWHHHVPWYLIEGQRTKDKGQGWYTNLKNNPFFCTLYSVFCTSVHWKSLMERLFIIPHIDQMVATSYFVAEKIQAYCHREATVIHPIIEMTNEKGPMKNEKEDALITLFTHGRLEPGKGLDMILRVWEKMKNETLPTGRQEGIMKNEEAVPVIPGTQVPSVAGDLYDLDSRSITRQSDTIKNKEFGNNLDSVFQRNDEIRLIIFGTGSLEPELREKGIDVRPFDRKNTFPDILSGKYGHVLGVYCSQIDAFGMAPLEAQIAGISTVILDSGGARETIMTNVTGVPVGYLVQSEEDLFRTISHYVQKKMFPKTLSNVNFFHNRAYYTPERLSSDLLSIIDKTPG